MEKRGKERSCAVGIFNYLGSDKFSKQRTHAECCAYDGDYSVLVNDDVMYTGL